MLLTHGKAKPYHLTAANKSLSIEDRERERERVTSKRIGYPYLPTIHYSVSDHN